MHRTIFSITLVALFGTVGLFGAEPLRTSSVDWQLITALWQSFAKAPSEETAQPLCDALGFNATSIEMPEDEVFREDLVDTIPLVIQAIREGEPWAIQLGFRLSKVSVVPHWYELNTVVADAAVSHPTAFLEELRKLDEEYPASDAAERFVGFMATYRWEEELERRADELALVDDPKLVPVRDRCVAYLDELLKPRPEPYVPELIHQEPIDQSVFSGVVVKGTMVVAEVTIAKDGSVKQVELLRGVHPDIDEAFLEALRQWLWEPPMKDGKPTEFKTVQMLRLHLQ